MKSITMKGKSVDDAVKAAMEVLGGKKENAEVKVIKEGKGGVLGIGSEEAEVEVVLKEGKLEDCKKFLQDILDKMSFVTIVDASESDDSVNLNVKGDDMGRIIGKEGATLKALEVLVSTAVSRVYGERVRVSVDAEEYKEKRRQALERLAKDAAEEVAANNLEKVLPPMTPADRRIIHMSLQEDSRITTYSEGVGKERRLVIAPKK
ncbi:MAG: RNA-binding cell elongation regulator Jag/EloR [bacterium]